MKPSTQQEGHLEGDALDGSASISSPTHVTFHIIIHSTQFYPLIGIKGEKIKEIYEVYISLTLTELDFD